VGIKVSKQSDVNFFGTAIKRVPAIMPPFAVNHTAAICRFGGAAV
jgi:hypothetical protein